MASNNETNYSNSADEAPEESYQKYDKGYEIKTYSHVPGSKKSNLILVEGARFRFETQKVKKNKKQEVLGGWQYYVCKSYDQMSHISGMKSFNCNSRIRIALPLQNDNLCEFMRAHDTCNFKDPEKTNLSVPSLNSDVNRVRSIVTNPTPSQKVAIEKVQNFIDVKAIDKDIECRITANPSDNAQQI